MLPPCPKKKSLIFLGSPQVSVTVLEALFDASASPNSSFEVAGIVTQPPSRRDRGKKVLPSPDGVQETGVSLAFTVRKLDAGPVIASERFQVDDQIKAPELLSFLFSEGSKLLISELPLIFDGSAKSKAVPQDDSKATLAPKNDSIDDAQIAPDEAWLSFDQEAFVLHNKVRAFAGWPGTRAKVVVLDDKSGQENELELKIITTRIRQNTEMLNGEQDYVSFEKGSLVFPCGKGTALEVLEVQLPGKKAINAAAFWNGLRGQKLKKL
ncbi:unnamed protein product [Thlaspi arvense]|uniref:Formyl transferase C-terminal domain-containing protein n=1 Tax=Thlaspi arvense TaxID=13288 RepID=A0AAU9SKV0_THLAR|nr:unnamed protein product [Thlaspi arvense]